MERFQLNLIGINSLFIELTGIFLSLHKPKVMVEVYLSLRQSERAFKLSFKPKVLTKQRRIVQF